MKIKTCIICGLISIFLFLPNNGADPEYTPIIDTEIPEKYKAPSPESIEIKFDQINQQPEQEEAKTIKEEKEDPEEKIEVNEFTYEEAQLLMKIAMAEAGNQGEEGMWLVMSVIVNRRNDDAFPDSIHDVAYQKNCFSTVKSGKINDVGLSEETHTALARIEKGEVEPDIVGFENKNNKSLERYFDYSFTYLDHNFYTKKK